MEQQTLSGLQALRAKHPWPDISALRGQPPYVWNLDGGGRNLVVDVIHDVKPKTFLEVGTFLGGSALQWLQSSAPEMTLIVGDTWHEHAEGWIFQQIETPAPWIANIDEVRALAGPLKAHGMFKLALHNLRQFQDRTIPIRMAAVELYPYIKNFVEPDIIYIDANKESDDYFLAHEIFPSAILCGDDWEWQSDAGEFPVRSFVHEIARRRRCEVITDRATWVLKPE